VLVLKLYRFVHVVQNNVVSVTSSVLLVQKLTVVILTVITVTWATIV